MSHETKAGLLVSCSFICLVGAVVYFKMNDGAMPGLDTVNGSDLPWRTPEQKTPVAPGKAGAAKSSVEPAAAGTRGEPGPLNLPAVQDLQKTGGVVSREATGRTPAGDHPFSAPGTPPVEHNSGPATGGGPDSAAVPRSPGSKTAPADDPFDLTNMAPKPAPSTGAMAEHSPPGLPARRDGIGVELPKTTTPGTLGGAPAAGLTERSDLNERHQPDPTLPVADPHGLAPGSGLPSAPPSAREVTTTPAAVVSGGTPPPLAAPSPGPTAGTTGLPAGGPNVSLPSDPTPSMPAVRSDTPVGPVPGTPTSGTPTVDHTPPAGSLNSGGMPAPSSPGINLGPPETNNTRPGAMPDPRGTDITPPLAGAPGTNPSGQGNIPSNSTPPLAAPLGGASPPIPVNVPGGPAGAGGAAAPGVSGRPAVYSDSKVESYDEETYICKPGDTFASICNDKYRTDKYSQALLMHNRSHPVAADGIRSEPPVLQPGQPVYIPPSELLQKRYPALISGTTPAAAVGQPVGTGQPPATSWSNPGERTYTVQQRPETFYEIAKKVLRDDMRWSDIWRLNQNFSTDAILPVGTVVRLPAQ
jgi:hypothetical protein